MSGKPGRIGADLVGQELDPLVWAWDDRDTMLYALGVGAGPERDLAFVYEGGGAPLVLPTFGAVPVGIGFKALVEWLGVDMKAVLHAGQSLSLVRPLPAEGAATVRRRIAAVWDKGGGALVEVEDSVEDGAPLLSARSTWWISGAGGFGGERGASAVAPRLLAVEPDLRFSRRVSAGQPAIHRLSGDRNPIHIDPAYATAAGFERPILHGLCTFGTVALDLVAALCPGRPDRVSRFEGRFVSPVLPGDELRTEVWKSGPGSARALTRVGDRVVLDRVEFEYQTA